jgi:excisionase family DNA binding protein
MLTRNVLKGTGRYGQSQICRNEDSMEKKTLSIIEAGRALGIGRSAAYEAAKSGQLPTIRIGRRLLVPVPLFERLLDSSASPAGPGTHGAPE